jgi:RNA polymerase sigma factor (TIGR02999 family)
MSDITLRLQAVDHGEKTRAEELLPLIYPELRRLAAARMAQEAAGNTLQPTALVHEAWLRLMGGKHQTWQNQAHFLGAAAEAMRRILIERARRKSRLKRGSGQTVLNIDELDVAETLPDDKVLLVDEALARLQAENPEMARVVVLKFFGGLTNEEVAQISGVEERTIRRHWTFAKAWLYQSIVEQS